MGPFYGPFLGVGLEDEPLVLREAWDAVYQYSERGGGQTVVTGGGLEEELLVRKEEWEVSVLVNATGSHYLERSTVLYLCRGVFTDKFTFNLNFPRIRTPRESSLTNQDQHLINF